jgi:hypothetical protein
VPLCLSLFTINTNFLLIPLTAISSSLMQFSRIIFGNFLPRFCCSFSRNLTIPIHSTEKRGASEISGKFAYVSIMIRRFVPSTFVEYSRLTIPFHFISHCAIFIPFFLVIYFELFFKGFWDFTNNFYDFISCRFEFFGVQWFLMSGESMKKLYCEKIIRIFVCRKLFKILISNRAGRGWQ